MREVTIEPVPGVRPPHPPRRVGILAIVAGCEPTCVVRDAVDGRVRTGKAAQGTARRGADPECS